MVIGDIANMMIVLQYYSSTRMAEHLWLSHSVKALSDRLSLLKYAPNVMEKRKVLNAYSPMHTHTQLEQMKVFNCWQELPLYISFKTH